VVDVVESVITPDPVLNVLYQALLSKVADLGPVKIEAKTTSVHLKSRAAFAGVHPRRGSLLLQIVAAGPIESPRVLKTDRVSSNRVHNHVRIESEADLDAELMGWLEAGYRLTG
jgi:hypothetical protein